MKYLLALLLILPVSSWAKTETYSCLYSSFSNGQIIKKTMDPSPMNFITDDSVGKAYMMMERDKSVRELQLYVRKMYVAFLEITPTGNLVTTTIDSKLNVVHSRNVVIEGKLGVTQFYGKCTKH